VFAPESIKFLENKRSLRFLMAGFCVLAGIAGLVSGHTQRGENDRRQSELTTQIASLQQQAERTERNTEHPPMINVPPSVINIPAPKNNFDPLKERTLVLANKLYDFARTREILPEALRDTDGDTEEVKKQKSEQRRAFHQETINVFEREYKKDIDDVIQKFSAKGVSVHLAITDEGVAQSGLPPFQLSTELRMMANQIDSTGHLIR